MHVTYHCKAYITEEHCSITKIFRWTEIQIISHPVDDLHFWSDIRKEDVLAHFISYLKTHNYSCNSEDIEIREKILFGKGRDLDNLPEPVKIDIEHINYDDNPEDDIILVD